MARRILIGGNLQVGQARLDAAQAHHVRDVLRLGAGDLLELFDKAGNVATGAITRCGPGEVAVEIEQVHAAPARRQIIVASAIPKGERADWMVEKLSELGVSRFIPLMTARSVVHPAGQAKRQRWQRLASESARQSRRGGVMQIDELTPLDQALCVADAREGIYLSTHPGAAPILQQSTITNQQASISLFIGPEGGWTEQEMEALAAAGLTGAKLTETILRVETAAVAAAAVVACLLQARRRLPAAGNSSS